MPVLVHGHLCFIGITVNQEIFVALKTSVRLGCQDVFMVETACNSRHTKAHCKPLCLDSSCDILQCKVSFHWIELGVVVWPRFYCYMCLKSLIMLGVHKLTDCSLHVFVTFQCGGADSSKSSQLSSVSLCQVGVTMLSKCHFVK